MCIHTYIYIYIYAYTHIHIYCFMSQDKQLLFYRVLPLFNAARPRLALKRLVTLALQKRVMKRALLNQIKRRGG